MLLQIMVGLALKVTPRTWCHVIRQPGDVGYAVSPNCKEGSEECMLVHTGVTREGHGKVAVG